MAAAAPGFMMIQGTGKSPCGNGLEDEGRAVNHDAGPQ